MAGHLVGLVWRGEDGRRWLVHRYGGDLVDEDGAPHPDRVREALGEPPGWREAMASLPQDCGCADHQGPHWLHMDLLDREEHAAYLWPTSEMSLAAFAEGEAERLHRLAQEMERAGISSLRDWLGAPA